MRELSSPCKIAVVQAAPVLFDRALSTQKAIDLIRTAAGHGAELVSSRSCISPATPMG